MTSTRKLLAHTRRGLHDYASARAALRALPRLSELERRACRRELEALYLAAGELAESLDELFDLMVFQGGYFCYDHDFPAVCRFVAEKALARVRAPRQAARYVEVVGIDGTYWFDDLVARAERLAAIADAA